MADSAPVAAAWPNTGTGTSSFIHDTAPSPGSASLQDAIHTELIDDIRALKAVEEEGITAAITGRAIYEGTLDFAEGQKLADG